MEAFHFSLRNAFSNLFYFVKKPFSLKTIFMVFVFYDFLCFSHPLPILLTLLMSNLWTQKIELLYQRLAVEILVSGFVFDEEDFVRPWEGQNDNLERYLYLCYLPIPDITLCLLYP